MTVNRCDRQIRIWGPENQEKLESGRVTVIGSGPLANLLGLYLAGLNIKNLRFISPEKIEEGKDDQSILLKKGLPGEPKAKVMSQALLSANPYLNVEGIQWALLDDDLTQMAISNMPDVIIDTGNDPGEEYLLFKTAGKHNIPVINLASMPYQTQLAYPNPSADVKTFFLSDKYQGKPEDPVTGGLGAALALDEIRKVILPLSEDKSLRGKKFWTDLRSRELFTALNIDRPVPGQACEAYSVDLDKRVGIIGAGSLGNPVLKGLADKGVRRLVVFDDDDIEEINLNRQVYFTLYDLFFNRSPIGLKKGQVLKEVLSVLNPGVEVEFIDGRFSRDYPDAFDVVYSCVDSFAARSEVHHWSLKYKKPVVNMGTDPDSGTCITYVPGKTSCLDCVMDIERLAKEERDRASCRTDPDPSVITSNVITGYLGVLMYDTIFNTNGQGPKPVNGRVKFDSKSHSLVTVIPNDSVCSCHERYAAPAMRKARGST